MNARRRFIAAVVAVLLSPPAAGLIAYAASGGPAPPDPCVPRPVATPTGLPYPTPDPCNRREPVTK